MTPAQTSSTDKVALPARTTLRPEPLPWRYRLWRALATLIACHFMVLGAEWVNRAQSFPLLRPAGSVAGFFANLWQWPSIDPINWSLNIALVLAGVWLLAAVFGRVRTALGVMLVGLSALALTNHYRVVALGAPLSLGDARLLPYAISYVWRVGGAAFWVAASFVVLAALLATIHLRRRLPRETAGTRAIWGITGLLVLASVAGMLRTPVRHWLPQLSTTGLRFKAEVAAMPFHTRGLALSLLMQAVPEAQSESINSADMLRRFVRMAPGPEPAGAGQRPHVIVWTAESLWDPRRLPGVSYSQDPLLNYRRLSREGARAMRVLVPTYGGDSSLSLYEILTGLSQLHVPAGMDAFAERLPRTRYPSLPRVLASHGYDTFAICGALSEMFESDATYSRLGFRFYERDDQFPHETRRRSAVADTVIAERVIKYLRTACRPTFAFVLAEQNHGPYRRDDYQMYSQELHASNPMLVTGSLQSAVQGVRESDGVLGLLVERLTAERIPAIVVFYGDHLPSLTETFVQSGYFGAHEPMTLAELRCKYATPAIAWTNSGLPLDAFDEETCLPGLTSALLQTLRIDHPFYTRLLPRLRQQAPAFSLHVSVDSQGELSAGPPATLEFEQYGAFARSMLGEDARLPAELFPEAAEGK